TFSAFKCKVSSLAKDFKGLDKPVPANSLPVNNFGNTAFFNDSFSVCVRYVVAAKWHQIQKAVVIQTFAVSSMTINRFSNSSCSLASTAKNPASPNFSRNVFA